MKGETNGHPKFGKQKGGWVVIPITKKEAEIVRKKYPDVTITRTCAQKSKRHRYYMTEDYKAMRLLKKR